MIRTLRFAVRPWYVAVRVTGPCATAVSLPFASTVATDGSLVRHSPLTIWVVRSDNVAVSVKSAKNPERRVETPLVIASASTVGGGGVPLGAAGVAPP